MSEFADPPDTSDVNNDVSEGFTGNVKSEDYAEKENLDDFVTPKPKAEMTPPPTDDEDVKPKGKQGQGKAKKPAKKGTKTKKPPAKKRKVAETGIKDGEEPELKSERFVEEEGSIRGQSEEKEDTEEPKKAKSRGRKKGNGPDAWSDEMDKTLVDLIKKNTDNDLTRGVPWKETYAEFIEAFPETEKKVWCLKNRWQRDLKHTTVDFSEEQIEKFKRAVDEINGSERNAAIAWRYEQLTGTTITKATVVALFKNLKIK